MRIAEGAVPPEQDRQRSVADIRGARERRTDDLEDVVDQADDQERRQRVEHDRRDDLVGAREGLETRRG